MIIAILFILLVAWFPARLAMFFLLAIMMGSGAPKVTISTEQGILIYLAIVSLFTLPFAVVQFAGSL